MRKTTGPRFCYDCGKQLWGNHKKLLIHKIDEYPRTFHKSCAKDALNRKPYSWSEYVEPSVQQQAEFNRGKYLPNGEEAK